MLTLCSCGVNKTFFHYSCLLQWLSKHSYCPACRCVRYKCRDQKPACVFPPVCVVYIVKYIYIYIFFGGGGGEGDRFYRKVSIRPD